MPKPLLIIISGPPCTGKTTLGKRIADDFLLPFVSKDGIKEMLFDSLGWKDREWSKRLGLVSYDLLYYFLECQLRAGCSLVVESNFKPDVATETFLRLKQLYDFEPFQVQCKTEGETLFSRFKQRAESSERHPGHVDGLNHEELRPALLKGKHEPLDIGGLLFELDTTDFKAVNYEGLAGAIRSAFGKG